MSIKPNKKGAIRQYAATHPGASLTEIARECGVSRALVSIVRSEDRARESGLANPHSPAPSLDEATSPDSFAEIIAKVLAGEGRKITPAEQAQIYSALATHPKAQPGTVISALNGLRALEASSQQANEIGPGIPLTLEQKVHRLSLLLMAVGKEIGKKAWRKAYTAPPSPRDRNPEESPDAGTTPNLAAEGESPAAPLNSEAPPLSGPSGDFHRTAPSGDSGTNLLGPNGDAPLPPNRDLPQNP